MNWYVQVITPLLDSFYNKMFLLQGHFLTFVSYRDLSQVRKYENAPRSSIIGTIMSLDYIEPLSVAWSLLLTTMSTKKLTKIALKKNRLRAQASKTLVQVQEYVGSL